MIKLFEANNHINNEEKIELSIKKQQQIQKELIGNIVPHKNHTLWEINHETLNVQKAKFSNKPILIIGEEYKNEVLAKDGHSYVSALTKKTALEKFKSGKNGTKEIIANVYKL